jgi:hypothetical protein
MYGPETLGAKRNKIITQIKEWKKAENNPVDESGRPAPLRMLRLALPGADPPGEWPFTARSEPAVVGDAILRRASEWTNEMNAAGEEMHFVIEAYFGNDDHPGDKIPLRLVPAARFVGSEAPIGDLRDPRAQGSTLVREAIGMTRDAWSLTGNSFRLSLESLERQVERLTAENQQMRSEREATWRLQQDMMDRQADRDHTKRKRDLQLEVMEMGGRKLVSYLPLVFSRVDAAMERFAGKEPNEDTMRLKKIVDVFVSKIKDQETAERVWDAMDLEPSQILAIKGAITDLITDEKRKSLCEEANNALKGMTPVARLRPGTLPLKKLRSGGSGNDSGSGSPPAASG